MESGRMGKILNGLGQDATDPLAAAIAQAEADALATGNAIGWGYDYATSAATDLTTPENMTALADTAPPVSSQPSLTGDLSVLGQVVQFGGQVYQYVSDLSGGQPVARPVVIQQVAPAQASGSILGMTPKQLLIAGGALAAVLFFL